jgi:hypothetical protein
LIQALGQLERLNSDIAMHKFECPGREAWCKERVPELIQIVKADHCAEVSSIAKIRQLGNDQDERVSRCRQYVKVQHPTSLTPSPTPPS